MSAKKRRVTSPELNYAVGGSPFSAEELARFRDAADTSAPPEAKAFFRAVLQLAEAGAPNLRLAVHRIVSMLAPNPAEPERTASTRRGRSTSDSLNKAAANYEVDVRHWDAMRRIGWGTFRRIKRPSMCMSPLRPIGTLQGTCSKRAAVLLRRLSNDVALSVGLNFRLHSHSLLTI